MEQNSVKDAVKAFSAGVPGGEGKIICDERMKCMCGYSVKLTDLTIINTGVFNAINDVCKGCKQGQKEDKKLARFVCVKCRTVLCHVKPAVDKTGFKIEANKTYHVSGCDQCCPGEKSFKLLEKVIWNRNMGKKN